MTIKGPFLTYFILAFLSVIVGTLSHEAGHYLAARALGYDSKISYKSTSFGTAYQSKYLSPVFVKYEKEIKAGKDFPGKQEYFERSEKFKKDHLLVICAGPLITLLISILAFFFLLRYHSSALIFLSLFSLRFPLVLGVSVLSLCISGNYYSDEISLANSLDLPTFSIAVIMGMIGLIISFPVCFLLIPKGDRGKLIWALALGGILSVVVWFGWLGEIILPN